MAATPKFKEDAYWTFRERQEFGGSDQKCFDGHPFYVGYNVTNSIYSAKMEAMAGLETIFTIVFPTMLENASSQKSFNGMKELQSMFFGIEKTITRYQMFMIQMYGRARTSQVIELGALPPPFHLLAFWLFHSMLISYFIIRFYNKI